MNRQINPYGLDPSQVISNPTVERAFITKVYTWMALALSITGLVAVATASNPEFMAQLLTGPTFLILVLVQLGMVLAFSFLINKVSANVATGMFVVYSAMTGLVLSTLFLRYTAESIGSVFFITAGTFAIVSVYGYVTKTDLTKIGNLLFMALIGIIIASIVNLFLQSSAVYWIVTYVGVVIFVGLIAYDTQRLKRMANGIGQDGEVQTKSAVVGALSLYLNFINLFLSLLRIFGNRR